MNAPNMKPLNPEIGDYWEDPATGKRYVHDGEQWLEIVQPAIYRAIDALLYACRVVDVEYALQHLRSEGDDAAANLIIQRRRERVRRADP